MPISGHDDQQVAVIQDTRTLQTSTESLLTTKFPTMYFKTNADGFRLHASTRSIFVVLFKIVVDSECAPTGYSYSYLHFEPATNIVISQTLSIYYNLTHMNISCDSDAHRSSHLSTLKMSIFTTYFFARNNFFSVQLLSQQN